MDNEREINSLVAENIALQWVLTQVLFRLGDLDPRIKGAIKSGFDDAAIGVRDPAIRSDKAAVPPYLAEARRVIEELRTARLAMRTNRAPAFNLLLTKGRGGCWRSGENMYLLGMTGGALADRSAGW